MTRTQFIRLTHGRFEADGKLGGSRRIDAQYPPVSIQRRFGYTVLLTLAVLFGCGKSDTSPVSTPNGNEQQPDASAKDNEQDAQRAKVEIKHGAGDILAVVKWRTDGAKLFDASGEELARITKDGSKYKVKDRNDSVVGFVTAHDDRFKIKDANQSDLFEFQKETDGDWKLKDPAEQLIYRVKQRDYGFEVEDKDDVSRFKIKLKGDKLSVRNSDDETVAYTKDNVSPVALIAFGFNVVEDVPMKLAMLVALTDARALSSE